MQAVEYTGEDGRRYRWRLDSGDCEHQVWQEQFGRWMHRASVPRRDWPEARKAMDVLISQTKQLRLIRLEELWRVVRERADCPCDWVKEYSPGNRFCCTCGGREYCAAFAALESEDQ